MKNCSAADMLHLVLQMWEKRLQQMPQHHDFNGYFCREIEYCNAKIKWIISLITKTFILDTFKCDILCPNLKLSMFKQMYMVQSTCHCFPQHLKAADIK